MWFSYVLCGLKNTGVVLLGNMKYELLVISVIFLLITACQDVKNQVSNITNNGDRVAVAYEEKEAILQKLFLEKGIDWNGFEIFFRVFKQEETLEVWAKNKGNEKFVLIKTYPFCTSSGTLGPKRKEGDRQIPEGFYKINRFNPKSSFYLSLGLNYPNKSDLILSDKAQPGSDIFIHGACVSVGCVSITDDKIKEVYLLANEAKKQGQKGIEAHFFPFIMTKENIKFHTNLTKRYDSYLDFWQNLKIGFDKFEEGRMLFDVQVDGNGRYK